MKSVIIRQQLGVAELAKIMAQWRELGRGDTVFYIVCAPTEGRYVSVKRLESPLIHVVSRIPHRRTMLSPHIGEVVYYETLS